MYNLLEIFTKQKLVNVSFLLFFSLFFYCKSNAQQNDTVGLNLELGKRGDLLFNRQISFHNVGQYSTPFARIFYKERNTDHYKSVGFLGDKYIHYFHNNPQAYTEFKRYRNYKIASYVSLVSVPIVAIAWVASASLYYRRAGLPRRRGPINFFPTDLYYTFPFSLAGLSVGSILLNQAAEQHLLMATELLNRRMKIMKPKN